ncbi:hypothetical protein [Streptomyces sp. NPDC001833]|uniref:hypothetical protein n=1 Tax=Streptomyces sp. NPDC001833 TaxID=3154658 RepID=UPI00333457CC
MGSNACVFCGATSNRVKITNEHLFPDWVNTVLTPQVIGPSVSNTRTWTGKNEAPQSKTWPVNAASTTTVRIVCEPCNNGWMSNLEGSMKPILEEPILGRGRARFTAQQQLDLAAWACMKTMVFEYFWPDDGLVFTPDDRVIVRTHGRPPATARVDIAAVESQGQPLQAFRVAYSSPGTGPDAAQADDLSLCMTMAIGCFVVQVRGGPGAGEHGFTGYGQVRADSVSIFPPALPHANWPPANPLNDQTLRTFAHPRTPIGS